MKIFYSLFFIFFLCRAGVSQTEEKNYRLICPDYILLNTSFEVSLIITNAFLDADHLELYFITGEDLDLSKIKLKSLYSFNYIPFKKTSLEHFSGNVFRTDIPLNINKQIPGDFFQVILTLMSGDSEESEFKVLAKFMDSSKVLGLLGDEEKDNIISAHLNFFKPQKNAGKALQLKNNSLFSVWFPDLNSDSLLAEFWLKTSGLPFNFLTVKSRLNLQEEFYFSTNDFQMFSVQSDEVYFSELKPGFISKNAWYHFEILFLFRERIISVYCNGELLSQKELTALISPEDLEFVFNNTSEESAFQIDLLRFIELNGSISESFENFNYINFISDSSEVICQFNFDSDGENLNREDVKVSSSGLQLVKSDAPIFARAPELNITLMSRMYELEWFGGDYRQAVSYILEKSSGNSSFSGIYTVRSENSGEKIYSYLDNKDDNSEIVYYRVKQVNKDGSIVYSSQVKIGQGMLTPFFIEQNFPNPFNPKTSIYIELFEDTDVEVTIYNLEGGEIAKIHKGFLRKGKHKFSFDGTGLPSGIYLYKVDTPLYSEIKKMILTK